MLGKMEMRTPPGSRPRDGRHCDLCGCSQPAVRCDKCGCQIFCLSCDDMYHRHPKRRFHLRKAVDPQPSMPQARPVLPVKVSQLPTANPGDPSKMPLPPPRKKKSLFGSFRKPSPSDNSPPLPKKEYSWSDRLGSIKKFMSNRPLPPLPPNADDSDEESPPATNGQSTRGDLSFIHRRNDERPPQLPQRPPKTPDFVGNNHENENRFHGSPGHMPGQIRNGSLEPNANHLNQNRVEENQWNNTNNQNDSQKFATLNRHQRGFMPPGVPGYPGGMHLSSSATDLHNLQNAEGIPGPGQVPPHFQHYPMNPHMPPHYPYPMYPQFPNYPQYFGNSFANISNPPTSEGDFSDHSETPSRHSSKRQPFRKRAKRSQSVMMDRMAFPGQFYPFGPYPGYGPWGAPMPMEAPPSPASSVRSLNRSGRTRRRKKLTSEDDDEEFSVSSSPLSRAKSSSSDPKENPRAPLATQTTSSEDESGGDEANRRNKVNTIQRNIEPLRSPSPAIEPKRITKLKKSSSKQSDSDGPEAPEGRTERKASRDSSSEKPVQQQPPTASGPLAWECKHCTFVNPAGNRICQVCCKTATPRTETPVAAQSRPSSAAGNSRKPSVDSEKECSSPEKRPESEQDTSRKERQDMASLNSALDEAEKQISKGLEELMKLKDDIDANMSKEKNKTSENQPKPESDETSKPVYKSSGRMRTSILDKLNLNKPQTTNASVSTSTDTQTSNNWTSDKILEARRPSNSSTTSETYNSPIAQSPELERAFLGSKQKTDSSCQTQQDSLAEYLEKKKAAEEAFMGRPVNNFGFGYGDRMDLMTSPVPSMYDRYYGGGYGMQRSHSRASLFTGRMNDFGPMEYGGGFGYGPTPMYRSVSRGSLTGDYPDGRMSEFHNLRKPDFYLSMEELVERRRQENIRAQGLELVRMIREAEQQGFNADDIQVALTHCGKQNPLEWLQENWRNMVDSVVTLSTNYGNDKKENDIGLLSENEARDSLRLHKGNIWAAVTECVEGRQRKYLELNARGNFSRKDIVDALTSSEGEVEMAYAKLSKGAGKPFLMRIWGAGEGAQNQDGARPLPEELNEFQLRNLKDETLNSDELSEEIWSEDGDWDEEDEYEGRGDIEDLQTCLEDLHTAPQEIRTPESDKSDYIDALPVDDRNASSPSDDIFFVIPEIKPEKKKSGFLSKLAALRKNSKENADAISNISAEEPVPEQIVPLKEDTISQNSTSSSEQAKNNGALSALKSTLYAIKDTVTGGAKSEKKLPCSQPERRTIIVTGQIDHESLDNDSKNNVKITSMKPLEKDNLHEEVSAKESSEIDKQVNSKIESKEKSLVKEETLKQDVFEGKLSNVTLKDNSLPKSSIENLSKPSGSKSQEETKKPPSQKQIEIIAETVESKPKEETKKPLSQKDNSQQQIENISKTVDSKIKEETEKPRSQKDNNQQQIENISKTVESKPSEDTKKPLSLAERLKFAKQTRSVTNVPESSTLQKETPTTDLTVKDTTIFKPSSEKLSTNDGSTASKAEKENKLMMDDNITTQKDFPTTSKKESKSENISLEVRDSGNQNNKKNVKEETEVQRIANIPVREAENSLDIKQKTESTELKVIKAEPSETVMPLTKLESSENKSIKEISNVTSESKNTETLDVKKTIQESIPKDITVARLENSDAVQTKSPTNKVDDSPKNNTTKQSNVLKTDNLVKSDAPKDISTKSVEGNTSEIKPITAASTAADVGETDSKINSESKTNVKTVAEINKQDSEMCNKKEEDVQINNIPNTTSPTVSENLNNDVLNMSPDKPPVSESDKKANDVVIETDKSQEKISVENETVISQNTADVSQTENATANLAPIIDRNTNSTHIDSEKESGSIDNRPLTEVKSTVKETLMYEIPKENQPQQSLLESSQTILPEIPEDVPQISSINNTNELNSISENSSNKTPVQTNVEKTDNNKEKITSFNKLDPVQTVKSNEITKNKDDSKPLLKTDIIFETLSPITESNENEEAAMPSTSTSAPTSLNEDSKMGKFKFSKSGKVKKTQPKDEKKDSPSLISDKNQSTAGTSTDSSSNKSSSIGADSGSNSVVVNEKGDASTSDEKTKELVENKLFNDKTTDEQVSDHFIKLSNEKSEAELKTSSDNKDVKDLTHELQPTDIDNKLPELGNTSNTLDNSTKDMVPTDSQVTISAEESNVASSSTKDIKVPEIPKMTETEQKPSGSTETTQYSDKDSKKTVTQLAELQGPVVSKEFPGNKGNLTNNASSSSTNVPESTVGTSFPTRVETDLSKEEVQDSNSATAEKQNEQHSQIQTTTSTDNAPTSDEVSSPAGTILPSKSASLSRTNSEDHSNSQVNDSDDTDIEYSDESRPSSVTPPSPVDALRSRFEGLAGGTSVRGSVRPQSPFRRMSFNSRKQVIALEKKRGITEKPWFHQKIVNEPVKITQPKRSIKQQLEMERKVRKMVADRKCRTYRKAEIVVQLMDMNFEEEEAIQAANECSTLEQAISYLQQECLLCAGHFPVSQIVSMTHCQHRACRECIRAYFTVQIRDRTILDLLCPFCNEPDIGDEDVAQDYFNHLDIMLKKLVDIEIHELFQRKLRDRVLMKDPNFRWCSQCSSGFIAMPNLKRLVCPDCNAVTCASCRRLWEREHQGISCEAFAALKDSSDPEAQAAGLAKMLTEDGIDCPSCHFKYALAKGGCMHFRCIQCQHDFCSGCSRPFRMGQKCGVSEFCAKLGLHAHHPRNCLFYLRDKEPEDLQKLLDMSGVKYNQEPPDGFDPLGTCQVMEQKETADGMVDDHCGKEVQEGYAGLCRIHYVEYLGQLVNKHKVDPIQIFENDDLELVLRRANIRLPPKRYRENDAQYREKLVNLIQEELPLDKMDGS